MRRTLVHILIAAAFCLAAAPIRAGEPSLKQQYQERVKDAGRSADPLDWLRIGTWIEGESKIGKKDRRHWLTYVHHQYGVAAKKKLDDHDVKGWLELADTMERLLGSRSVSNSYLAYALERNPEDARLVAALGKDDSGQHRAAGVIWKGRKAKAEAARTPQAFRELAAWCAQQKAVESLAEHWETYCIARAVHLEGKAGTAADPVARAEAEAARKLAAPMKAPGKVYTPLESSLGRREARGMEGDEYDQNRTYRLESGGKITYADALPTGAHYDAVWKRGPYTRTTLAGDTVIMETSTAWWRLLWDPEMQAWVEHTRAERRVAQERQAVTARARLERARGYLARLEAKLAEYPEDAERAVAHANRLAAKGGRARDFARALSNILSLAGSQAYRRTQVAEQKLKVKAWEAKLAELESHPGDR